MTNSDHDKIDAIDTAPADPAVKVDTALSADPGVTAGGAAGELGTAAQGTVSQGEAEAKLTEPPDGAYGEGHTGNPQALNKPGEAAVDVTAGLQPEQSREDRDRENPAGPGLQPRPDLRGA